MRHWLVLDLDSDGLKPQVVLISFHPYSVTVLLMNHSCSNNFLNMSRVKHAAAAAAALSGQLDNSQACYSYLQTPVATVADLRSDLCNASEHLYGKCFAVCSAVCAVTDFSFTLLF